MATKLRQINSFENVNIYRSLFVLFVFLTDDDGKHISDLNLKIKVTKENKLVNCGMISYPNKKEERYMKTRH